MYKCDHCNAEVEEIQVVDDGHYCDRCFNELFVCCDGCGETFSKDCVTEVNGNYYCDDCFDERYVYCCECGDIVERDDAHEYDGEHYCEECFYQRYTYCYNCDEPIRREDAHYYGDNAYCPDCFYDYYDYCHNCGYAYPLDELYEYGGYYYCQDCYEEEADNVIHDYSYKPEPVFFKERWENTLYMGVELEVEVKGSGDRISIADELVNYGDRWERMYCKYDGSLSNGFEIVTHPHTLQQHKKLRWRDILEWLDSRGCTSYDSGNCGLHIHLNKNFFTEKELQKLVYFFHRNKSFIRRFSQRRSEHIREWADWWDSSELAQGRNSSRYRCINITGSTVEVRIFRGTLCYDRFLATLQFCDAVSHFVKQYSLAFIMSWSRDSWKEFCRFIERNGYHHLVKYFKDKDLFA